MNKIQSVCSVLMLAAPLASHATDQLIPAGSTVTCRVAEHRISSKTTAIGDPVLCTLDPVETYGRGTFPYGSYLEGTFVDYKDPGHLVGKGWMELKFDRLYLGNRVLPVSAKVVEVPGYKVSREGRVLGKGHAVRDTVEWLIPVLWPIDLINLPRRGPAPVIKPETKLTLELMDDIGIPEVDRPSDEQYPQHRALIERAPEPQQQNYPQPPAYQQPAQQVYYQTFQAPQPAPQVIYQQAPPQIVYVPSPPQVVYRYLPPPRYYAYPPPPPPPPYRYPGY